MAKVKGNISIERPVDVVFDEVADIRNEPTYNPNMISAELKTEEPIGKGSEFSAKAKSRNDTIDMSITYTEFRKSEYIGSHTISNNMEANGGLTFSSNDNGTLLEWNWDVRLMGNLKLFTPLISMLGNRQEYEIWQGLKAKLEKGD
jgi:uncharacterized membrane protein